jgi:hypothetical protein
LISIEHCAASPQKERNRSRAAVGRPTSSTAARGGRQTLRKWIEDTPHASTRVIVSEATKRPYVGDHFRHEFARIRTEASLPNDLQFRDLRRTALTNAGDNGATDDELRALSGHMSRDVLSVYVVPIGAQPGAAQRKRQRGRNKTAPKV